MIKFILAITGVVCAFIPSLACIQTETTKPEQMPVAEARYSSDFEGGSYIDDVVRTVYYSSSNVDYYESPYKAPRFVCGRNGSCSVSAGGVSITYNDRQYGNLIPNYAPKYIGSRFSYGTYNDEIENMFSRLYDLMGTTSAGTTVDGFKRGMSDYVKEKGYGIDLLRATGNYYNVNYEYLKEQLRQDRTAVIFLHGFSTVATNGINSFDGYETILNKRYSGYHTMTVYGYMDRYYYDESGVLTNRDTYLYVQNCYENAALELLNINNYCTVDDIYIVDIH